ncbi:MAG TPA: glycosyltransferase family 4 protein [Solirubrobacteraceae bacterium]|nr:glycosyltransferase family 4 protein [Solirubrobacteraceae bacterium]
MLADLPHPPMSGNHLRDLQNLRVLSLLGYDVRIVAGVARTDPCLVGPIGTLCASQHVPGYVPGAAARIRRVLAVMRGALATPARDPWAENHTRAHFEATVLRAARRIQPDVILVRSLFGHLVEPLRATTRLVILDAHDSQVLVARALSTHATRSSRLGLRVREVAAARAEASYQQADELWVPSRREQSYFARRTPGLATVIVPNGIEPEPLSHPRDSGNAELLLIAGFGWPPNVAAAETLVEELLPRVRRRHPNAHVTLVGRDLSPRLIDRWRNAPVRWLGTVESTGPYLRRAAAVVFAPPSSAATGTPLKIAEALAAGLPLVATPVASEALGLEPGVHAVIDYDLDVLADGICRIIEDASFADRLRDAGRSWVVDNLSSASIAARLRRESVVASTPESARAHP